MNWNRPRADEVEAPACGLSPDSTWAVASRYWKLVPVACAAWRMAPVTVEPAAELPGSTSIMTDSPADRGRLPPALSGIAEC